LNHHDARARATEIQCKAADPDRSAAVRASAGSGKTRTLVDRFVRLCVEGEHNDVHPRSILAITFTRKAATEIRKGLLKRARLLAMESQEKRREALAELFAARPHPAPLPVEEDRAARLYERLLEDPAGLQVGTIHSFCQRILARFATEAGLDPHAGLIENREDLLDEALDRLMVEVATDPELGALAAGFGGRPASVRLRVRNVFAEQMLVDRWLRWIGEAGDIATRPRTHLAPVLLAQVRMSLLGEPDPGDAVTADDLAPALMTAAADLAGPGLDAVERELDAAELEQLTKPLLALRGQIAVAVDPSAVRDAFFTSGGDLRKFTRAGGAELKARFQELVIEAATPVLRRLRRLDLVDLYRLNRATLVLGLRALDILDELKRRDRVLDFGDLEDMARDLMGDDARAMSLLFRLEDSLRHVLVDEFQDTNFNQHDILAPFIEEFLSGGDENGTMRTVFFVGDLKQSIYGFRGAEPGIFVGEMTRRTPRGIDVHSLPTNFRSLPPVVEGVGSLFSAEPLVSRLPDGEADDVRQLAFREGDAGPVTVMAAYEDAEDGLTGHQQAAAAAAAIVHDLVEGGATTSVEKDGERPLLWSDVMVLYRSRTGVSLYEQAFRDAGIPIEPAGRGMLAASREVQDVLALLRWLVWPEDDVALATVLRSPAMRLSEAKFQELLAARGLFRTAPDSGFLPPAGLWKTLRRATDEEFVAITRRLKDWRADTGFVTCHELLRRIYREGDLPARYEAAAGPQAGINLERLYDLALAPEIAATPTVRRFIDLVDKAGRRGGQEEGTAAAGIGEGRVRFMTIHGAKGLQAPVVLLVDADRSLTERGSNVRLEPDHDATPVVFGTRKEHRLGPAGLEDVLGADPLRSAGEEAARAADREETNLLYVALTRAQDRLYVLGGRGKAKNDGEPRTPLRRLRAAAENAPGTVVALDDPAHLQRPPVPVEHPPAALAVAETVLWQPPVLGGRTAAPAPSAAARHGDREEAAVVAARAAEHGLRVHLLLQLAVERGAVPPGEGAAHDEARTVFADSRLDWVFRPETVGGCGLAEAPVISRSDNEPVAGIIDRLVIRPDRVDIIDYKTDRWGGDAARCDELLARYGPQLAAYRDAVAALHPGLPVHTWLLLTDPAGRTAGSSGLREIVP